jgi:hypothetical protein
MRGAEDTGDFSIVEAVNATLQFMDTITPQDCREIIRSALNHNRRGIRLLAELRTLDPLFEEADGVEAVRGAAATLIVAEL